VLVKASGKWRREAGAAARLEVEFGVGPQERAGLVQAGVVPNTDEDILQQAAGPGSVVNVVGDDIAQVQVAGQFD